MRVVTGTIDADFLGLVDCTIMPAEPAVYENGIMVEPPIPESLDVHNWSDVEAALLRYIHDNPDCFTECEPEPLKKIMARVNRLEEI